MEHSRRRDRDRQGFTLIEIMVVIAIIGLIATLVVPGVMNRLDEANISATKVKMSSLKQVISSYRLAHNKIPDTLQELLQEDPKNFDDPWAELNTIRDAWDNEFIYDRKSSRKFELISLGADGLEGGEGPDADISSADNSMPGQ